MCLIKQKTVREGGFFVGGNGGGKGNPFPVFLYEKGSSGTSLGVLGDED